MYDAFEFMDNSPIAQPERHATATAPAPSPWPLVKHEYSESATGSRLLESRTLAEESTSTDAAVLKKTKKYRVQKTSKKRASRAKPQPFYSVSAAKQLIARVSAISLKPLRSGMPEVPKVYTKVRIDHMIISNRSYH